MRLHLLVSTLLVAQLCHAQAQSSGPLTVENFDKVILSYEPEQMEHHVESDYEKAIFFLQSTQEAVAHAGGNVIYADYWNICMALLRLKEDPDVIAYCFTHAITDSPEDMCQLIAKKGPCGLDQVISQEFFAFTKQCNDLPAKEEFDLEEYITKHKIDPALARTMRAVQLRDKKYRDEKPVDWNKQRPLDQQNQRIVDSLFTLYGSYIGTSHVGEKLSTAMWLVIQHSHVDMMERYLPHLISAHAQGNLAQTPIRMIIDRIYAHREGYQIYGSQSGVDLAPEDIRAQVREKYGF